jgi:hypothetical protein
VVIPSGLGSFTTLVLVSGVYAVVCLGLLVAGGDVRRNEVDLLRASVSPRRRS